jgi:hypothetical protein
MKRTLLTLGATALAVFATLLFRGYLLREFSGQRAGTLYSPWALLDAGFIFITTVCLFTFVAVFARSSWFVLCSAAVYGLSIAWPGGVWLRHPESLGEALSIYPAVYLSEIALVAALLAVLVCFRSRKSAQ